MAAHVGSVTHKTIMVVIRLQELFDQGTHCIIILYQLTMDNVTYLTDVNNEATTIYPKHITFEQFETISLRNLRDKKKQTDQAIESVQTRINYIKAKENHTLKKVYHIRKRLNDVERLKQYTKESKQQTELHKKKLEIQQMKKTQFNKLFKQHLECNKKIVHHMLNGKIQEDATKLRIKNSELELQSTFHRQTRMQQNAQKVEKIKQQELILHHRKKSFILERIKTIKRIKESKLKMQETIKQHKQQEIIQLGEKQQTLIKRLELSEKFKQKCEQEYLTAKQKFHKFYQTARDSRRRDATSRFSLRSFSRDEEKCNIFIS